MSCLTETLLAPNSVHYVVRTGTSMDAGSIYALVFVQPDENILQRTYTDVQRMLDEGEFYVATTDTGEVVGAGYIKQPEGEAIEAEFGGAYVTSAHRRRGLLTVLGDVSLADYRVKLDPPDPVIAHVVVGN